jgi:hypothetical protein
VGRPLQLQASSTGDSLTPQTVSNEQKRHGLNASARSGEGGGTGLGGFARKSIAPGLIMNHLSFESPPFEVNCAECVCLRGIAFHSSP